MPDKEDSKMTDLNEQSTAISAVTVERFDEHGKLIERFEGKNLVTQVGDQMYYERGAGISSPPAAPTGIRLGSGATSGANAIAKTGAGAALTTYLSGSNKAFDSTYPQSSLKPAATTPVTPYDARQITYKRTYAAGEATTASPITEAVIVNDTIATDATSTAANTISRLPVTGISAKGSSDVLTVVWNHYLAGA